MSAPSFLQSPEWQAIQQRMGRRTERIASVLVIRHDLPLGFHYLYAPRPQRLGPNFFSAIGERVRERGALFLKINPLEPLPSVPPGRPSRPLQPPATILIDCQQDDAKLRAAMHPKTRYNIRLAERHGVTVRRAERPAGVADIETFLTLLASAARRDEFQLHPVEHYRILLDVATDQFSNDLFIAEHRGTPIAVALVNFYRPAKTATYLHGGSTGERREVMAPHLLHWCIIQYCREQGITTYDFGGIDGARWPGLSRFKAGFGGREHCYPPSADYVFRPWLYALYRLQHRVRHAS